EVVALAILAEVVRIRIARAPVEQVELRIVAAGLPGGTAAARQHVRIRPGLAARLAARRNRVEAPDACTGLRIVRIDEPARRDVAAGNADNHLVLDDERCLRNGV